jgi:hypothetical protein
VLVLLVLTGCPAPEADLNRVREAAVLHYMEELANGLHHSGFRFCLGIRNAGEDAGSPLDFFAHAKTLVRAGQVFDPPLPLLRALERRSIVGSPLVNTLSQCQGYFGTHFYEDAILLVIERVENLDPDHASVYINENAGTFGTMVRIDLARRHGIWRVTHTQELTIT